MTVKEAYGKCHHMWRWLAENPGKNKSDYFEMKGISIYDRPESNCYFCAEVGDRGEVGCTGCLGRELWGRTCTADNSSFDLWRWGGSEKIQIEGANQIADFCKHKLDEIERSEDGKKEKAS